MEYAYIRTKQTGRNIFLLGNGMGLRNWTPKIAALGFIGSVITVLFMISVGEFWKHDFRSASWYLASGVVLTLIFFRNRKIAFAVIALSFIFVNVGFNAVFHPTRAGILVTLGSIVGMYALSFWGARKYPHLKRTDWKTLFDRDP
jgi:hypothetical protein